MSHRECWREGDPVIVVYANHSRVWNGGWKETRGEIAGFDLNGFAVVRIRDEQGDRTLLTYRDYGSFITDVSALQGSATGWIPVHSVRRSADP